MPDESAPLSTETWASLLGRWIEFAQASAVLPPDGDGERWRSAVASIIEIQAIAFAIQDLAVLPRADRDVARARASVVFEQAAARIHDIWRGRDLPESVVQLIEDARRTLEGSRFFGSQELWWPGPGQLEVPEWPDHKRIRSGADSQGSLWLAPPGTILMAGSPVGWWCDREPPKLAAALIECRIRPVAGPRQVYRRLDDAGRAIEDIVVPFDEELPAGVPLLAPLLDCGTRVGDFILGAAAWGFLQRAALGGKPGEKLKGRNIPLRFSTP